MNYTYLRTKTNGNLVYKITLNLYRDCYQSNIQLDDEIAMGVYLNNGNKDRYTVANFKLIFHGEVKPPGTIVCSFYDDNVCIEYGFYEGNIELPPSSVGYHITFERCCRNKQTNIPDNDGTPFQGQTYYCFIPDNLYENSSPVFSGVPSPYMCANDTTTFDFSAIDPDGDKLTYRLVHPYAGASLANSAPDPADKYSGIPLIAYNPGYTFQKPFGVSNGSLTSVNDSSGLTTIFAPSVGSYVVAIEVTESRNGVVLSKVRLDLQILVLDCPKNDRPQVRAPDGQSFVIEEGETLCFEVNAFDPDDDFIKLTAKGPIVDGTNNYTGPRAQFTPNNGKSNASAEFCWRPDCDMDRDEPYFITITAEDDGCPPKFNTMDFAIIVTPFVGADSIQGPREVCRYNQYEYRAIGFSQGSSFIWEADNGVIVGKADSSVVVVRWDGSGIGKLSMTELSQFGCPGETTEININIAESPATPIILGSDTVCKDEFDLAYSVNLNSASSYEWLVENANIKSVNANNLVLGTYSLNGFTVKVIETNATGCSSDTAELTVFVSDPKPILVGPITVCPNSTNIEYLVLNGGFASLNWTVNGASSYSSFSNGIKVNWGNEGIGSVQVVATDRHSCVSDPEKVDVAISYTLEKSLIFGPGSVCEFDQDVEYSSLAVNGVVYSWTVNGGIQVNGDSSSIIAVDWGSAGNGVVTVQTKAYDLVNDSVCLSPESSINVTINPKPTADEIIGEIEFCQFDDTAIYSINGAPNSTYEWKINGNNQGIIGQGTNTIKVYWSQSGNFSLSVLETSNFGCPGEVVDTVIIVHPKPISSAIAGPDTLCSEDVLDKVYSVNGFANSNFIWEIGNYKSFNGQGSNTVTVNWEPSLAYGYLEVTEVSEFGCVGDSVVLEVLIDRLAIDMRFVSVGTPDNRMIINWKLAEKSNTNGFTIQKRVAGGGAWQDLSTVGGNVFEFTEMNLNTDVSAYEYRVVATNKCGTLISSEPHTSILLEGYQDENFDINFSFSPYMGWENGVDYYEIYESINKGPYTVLGGAPVPRENNKIENNPDQFIKCYRILAHEYSGERTVSWSNDVCFTFAPNVYVPNAFTPNSDNLNDGFGVVGVAVKEYNIEIYNRWGEKLYESTDIDGHWDATYMGRDVQVGTYMYLIKFSDFEDKFYQRSGTINLIR